MMDTTFQSAYCIFGVRRSTQIFTAEPILAGHVVLRTYKATVLLRAEQQTLQYLTLDCKQDCHISEYSPHRRTDKRGS